MRETKPASQLTRIMPRRRKKKQQNTSSADTGESSERQSPFGDNRRQRSAKRVIAKNSSRSESLSETEAIASTSTRDSRRGNRKRKRIDMEDSACKKSSPTYETPDAVDNRSNRESPELGCSICLGPVENRAFTDACYHTFCFECLVEWSRVRAVCPLCKKSFHSIIHSFRSYDDYKLYQVPTSYVSSFVNISGVNNSESSGIPRVGRFLRSSTQQTVPTVNDGDHMLALRRRLYTHSEEMQLRGLWSSDGVVVPPPHQVSPAMFDCYPVMLERVRPWVLRDVAIIIGNGDVQLVASIVLDLLRHFPITSEDFYERLFPYLGLHTRRFILELDAFARSPFDMTTYDARVVYSTGANVETSFRMPAEHVEDISSSDDSDIEIVSPAVITSPEPISSHISTMTDHVVPDLLRCLRTFQHNLLMSFSLMNRHRNNSGLESPIPGPSGLGQAVVADESDNGSHASGSARDAEERSNSPLILSDADSDVMVVDIDRSVHSPIHISSGEENGTAERIRAHRLVKRRKRRARRRHRGELEQSDNSMGRPTEDCVAKDEILPEDISLQRSDPHATGHKATDHSVESNVELMHAMEASDNDHIQNQSSSRSSSVHLIDHSLAGTKVSPLKSYLSTDDEDKTAIAEKFAFQATHPKRSRSANSVVSQPVMPVSSASDLKQITCKKHVSGHKSSKQKAKKLVAVEAGGDNMEKSAIVDRVGTMAGSRDLPDASSSDQNSVNIPDEVTVPSVGESSTASTDLSSISQPAGSSCNEVTDEQLLSTGDQTDDGIPVPSTSESCSLQPVAFSGPNTEDFKCSNVQSSLKVTCVIADSTANESSDFHPCDDNPCSSTSDGVLTPPVDTAELSENATSVVNDGSNTDDCDHEIQTALDLSVNSEQNDDIFACTASEPKCCLNTVVTFGKPPVPSDTDVSHSDFIPIISAASSSSSSNQMDSHLVKSCISNNFDDGISIDQPLLNESTHSLPIVPQETERSSSQDSLFSHNTTTIAASSENLTSCNIDSVVVEPVSGSCHSTNCILIEQCQSVSSPSHAGLVIDESQESPASPDQVISDDIFIGSPVGIDSSDTDSEVEWLESGVSGRQHCISISSNDSSIVCSLSDVDDIESILSDTDILEIFDDEPHLTSPSHSAESNQQSPAGQNSGLSHSLSDVASSFDEHETESVTNSERVKVEKKPESHENEYDNAAATINNSGSYDDVVV